jgi:hypothetical protein
MKITMLDVTTVVCIKTRHRGLKLDGPLGQGPGKFTTSSNFSPLWTRTQNNFSMGKCLYEINYSLF